MPKRMDYSGKAQEASLGAKENNSTLTTVALVAAGGCVAAPTAVVLGSLQTTFVVSGAVASAAAYGAHRVSKGEKAWPFGDKKKEPKAGDKPTKVEHNGKDITDEQETAK